MLFDIHGVVCRLMLFCNTYGRQNQLRWNKKHMQTRWFSFALIVGLLCCLSSLCCAQDCLIAVWAGKIGNTPITLVFSEVTTYDDSGEHHKVNGRYYYNNNLQDLILRQHADGMSWDEFQGDRLTGHIDQYICQGSQLSARWTSIDRKTHWILSAHPIKQGYSKNRLKNPSFIQQRKVIDQHQYALLTLPNIDSKGLILVSNAANTKMVLNKINQTLKQAFVSQIEIELDCKSQGRMQDRTYESVSEYAIVDWNQHYVSIRNTSSDDCGGAHPNYGESITVYDVETGQVEDTSLWLNTNVQSKYNEIQKENSLGALLGKTYLKQRLTAGESAEDAEDCLDAISFYGNGLWTNGKQLSFNTYAPHAALPCIAPITLNYTQVAPFLSPKGKAAMQASIKK